MRTRTHLLFLLCIFLNAFCAMWNHDNGNHYSAMFNALATGWCFAFYIASND